MKYPSAPTVICSQSWLDKAIQIQARATKQHQASRQQHQEILTHTTDKRQTTIILALVALPNDPNTLPKTRAKTTTRITSPPPPPPRAHTHTAQKQKQCGRGSKGGPPESSRRNAGFCGGLRGWPRGPAPIHPPIPPPHPPPRVTPTPKTMS